MLDSAFSQQANEAGRPPTSKVLTVPPLGRGFEQRAFAALLRNAKVLGIKAIWQCNAARMDGYLENESGETILLEMKESLRWGSAQSATFQFLAGRSLLKLNLRRGIIVFERWSEEWGRTVPHGARGQLALHAGEVSEYIDIGALQVQPNGLIGSPA